MKNSIFTLTLLLSCLLVVGQNEKAETVKKTFSRTTSIETTINSNVDDIWQAITTTEGYSDWNSTVLSLDGDIKVGEKILLVSTLDPSRTFKLKVKEMIPNEKLVWGDALGERVYTITQLDGQTVFNMTEKIGGLMFPLFAKKIPSFDASFEQFVKDLKTHVE